MTYQEQLEDPRWQKKRLEVFQRDNFTCQRCWSSKKQLHAHHRYYISGRMAWQYSASALLTLCRDCHREVKEGQAYLYDAYGPSCDESVLCLLIENATALDHGATAARAILEAVEELKQQEPGLASWGYISEVIRRGTHSNSAGDSATAVDGCLCASTG
jgi:hypothetical protein